MRPWVIMNGMYTGNPGPVNDELVVSRSQIVWSVAWWQAWDDVFTYGFY